MVAHGYVYALLLSGNTLHPGQLYGLFSTLQLAEAAQTLCIAMGRGHLRFAPPAYAEQEDGPAMEGPSLTRLDAFDRVIGDDLGLGPPKGCVVVQWYIDSNKMLMDPTR